MFKVWEFCRKKGIMCEASLDRYIKCAIGVCGQCDCDGQRVCVDGPVFDAESLETMKDFGTSALFKERQKGINLRICPMALTRLKNLY